MMEVSLRIMAPRAKRTEILDVLRRVQGPTEVTRGCRACRILQDVNDENQMTYLVQWETRQDLEAHFRSDRFRTLLPYIEMSVLPPEMEIREIDVVGGIDFLVAILSSAVDHRPPGI